MVTDRVAVDWVVSEAEDFSSIAASGSTVTDASRDFTVSVDATGLKPWKRYWYQFSSGKVTRYVAASNVLMCQAGADSCTLPAALQ
jgi:alkaline phosphatase D